MSASPVSLSKTISAPTLDLLKLNEVLINSDEIPYTWEFENIYMIRNPSVQKNLSIDEYSNIKKIENMHDYNSGSVEKISKDELKKILINSGLLKN